MAKYQLRNKARELRKKGVSVKSIAKKLQISRSTVSRWVRDIDLTVEQLSRLRLNELKGRELGRIKSLIIKRNQRKVYLEKFKILGKEEFLYLSKKELLVAGLALYWGKGGKSNHRVEFCNSDPRIIIFMEKWLEECFGVRKENLKAVVGINELHLNRETIVKEYWSKITNIPLTQFRKTSFKKALNKKIYDNFDSHYGTLSILVAKSSKLYYEILGLIEGLYSSKMTELAA